MPTMLGDNASLLFFFLLLVLLFNCDGCSKSHGDDESLLFFFLLLVIFFEGGFFGPVK